MRGRALVGDGPATAARARASTGAGGTRTSSPPREQLEAAARGRSASGSASAATRSRSRCRSRRSSCRAPRLTPPAALAEICSRRPLRARLPRARQGLPRRRARLPRASSRTRPTWSPTRATRRRSRRCSTGAPTRGAAAIPYGGGTSVVGGVEPRVGDDYAGAVTIDLRRARPGARGRRGLARGADPGRRAPARRSRTSSREHGLTLRHFPQSFEFSTLGGWIATRAGGHFATLYTHIDDLVESVRAVTPRGDLGEPAAARARAPGPSPDRMLIGSEGILGVITEAWVRVQRAPALQGSRPRCAFDDFAAGAEAVRALVAVGPEPRQLPPARRGRGRDSPAPATPGEAVLVLGFESAHHPVDALDATGARARARPRRARSRPGGETRETETRRRDGGDRSAPGATPSSRRPTCATRSSPAACSPRPSRPRSPGTASPTSTRR